MYVKQAKFSKVKIPIAQAMHNVKQELICYSKHHFGALDNHHQHFLVYVSTTKPKCVFHIIFHTVVSKTQQCSQWWWLYITPLVSKELIIMSHIYCSVPPQLVNAGEDVLLFYTDKSSFQSFIEMMRTERERIDASSPSQYHINLVHLLACCTEGKNVYTEIKCHSLLPLDDIVRVATHEDCLPEVVSF